jgi:hypothetical protein
MAWKGLAVHIVLSRSFIRAFNDAPGWLCEASVLSDSAAWEQAGRQDIEDHALAEVCHIGLREVENVTAREVVGRARHEHPAVTCQVQGTRTAQVEWCIAGCGMCKGGFRALPLACCGVPL